MSQTQLARVSLAKFSYTTAPNNHNGPLNWSHIFGNGDMSAVLERQNTIVLFRVLQGPEILEEVNLTYHTQETARQTRNQIKPSFAVIVKSPCLAVKYPTGGNCVCSILITSPRLLALERWLISLLKQRRFQVKFSSDRDYYAILAILSSIDCPISESSVTGQPARRSTQWRTVHTVPYPGSNGLTGSRPVSSTTHTDFSQGTAQPSHSVQQTQPAQLGIQTSTPVQPQPDISDKTMAYHDPQTLNQILPPKRDLPFSKPAAKKPRKDTTPTKARDLTQLGLGLGQGPGLGPQRSQTAFAPTQTPQTSISPATSMTPGPSLSITSIGSAQTPGLGPGPAPALLPRQDPTPVLGTGLPSPEVDLAAYTASPTPVRITRLESWLCENIQDDDFLKLCQDVEGVWKRVAFGER